MRCDKCPLCPTNDVCDIAYSEYGLEHKDGMGGCKHSWNWCKRQAEIQRKELRFIGVLKGAVDMSINVTELTKEQWIRKIKRLSKEELVDVAIALDDKYEYELKRSTKMLQDIAFAQRKLIEYGYEWKPKFRDNW